MTIFFQLGIKKKHTSGNQRLFASSVLGPTTTAATVWRKIKINQLLLCFFSSRLQFKSSQLVRVSQAAGPNIWKPLKSDILLEGAEQHPVIYLLFASFSSLLRWSHGAPQSARIFSSRSGDGGARRARGTRGPDRGGGGANRRPDISDGTDWTRIDFHSRLFCIRGTAIESDHICFLMQ